MSDGDEITLDDLPEIPDELLCPECEDGRITSTAQPTRYFCENCGVVMDGDPPEDYVVIND